MQRHLDVVPGRYLPAVAAEGFVLGAEEPLGSGLQRISLDQFDRALSGLTDPTADVDEAIHEARKAMKRLRAILRMVRPEIGDRVYRFENTVLRDAARSIAAVRDGAVTVETVRKLAARYEGRLAVDVFDELSERLDARAIRLRRRVLEDGTAVDDVVATLSNARTRFAGWPTDPRGRSAYGTAIRDRFDAVGVGVRRTYGRGRREMHAAFQDPTAHHFHLWRKRVKYLRHQMEILEPLWPEIVGGTATGLHRLGDVLGDEHDLAELLGLLSVQPDLCPDPVDRSLFAALAQHRRTELQSASRVLGTRLYAEKPKAFAERVEAYWDSHHLPTPLGQLLAP